MQIAFLWSLEFLAKFSEIRQSTCDIKLTEAMSHTSYSSVSFLNLSWDDIVFQNILPLLSIKDWFNLRSVSTNCKLMIDEYFARIKTLELANQRHFTPLAFKVISSSTENLRHLNLSHCKWLSDSLLIPVFTNNKHIESVNLNSCTALTFACLQPLIVHCKELKSLKMQNCHWVTRGCIEALTHHQNQLEEVDLTSCWDLGDAAIVPFLAKFPNLRILCLSNIYSITDQTLYAISFHNRKLQHLNVKGCWRITDRGLRLVGEYCRNLKRLQVLDCRNITGASLDPLRSRMEIDQEPFQFMVMPASGCLRPIYLVPRSLNLQI
ncbi:hypothetical protein B566_EDAN008019 [Ephemera danica]|nr:hypothetical protein B566_EDAN008019 [Ephemera danica]